MARADGINAVEDFHDSVAVELSRAAGINVVVDDTLNVKVTVRLTEVPFDQAVRMVAKAAGATVTTEGGLYVFLNARAGYQAPVAAPEQTGIHLFDLSGVDYGAGLTLISEASRSLEIEAFPDLEAVLIRGPYTLVNAARTAVENLLRTRSAELAEGKVVRVMPLISFSPGCATRMGLGPSSRWMSAAGSRRWQARLFP